MNHNSYTPAMCWQWMWANDGEFVRRPDGWAVRVPFVDGHIEYDVAPTKRDAMFAAIRGKDGDHAFDDADTRLDVEAFQRSAAAARQQVDRLPPGELRDYLLAHIDNVEDLVAVVRDAAHLGAAA